MNPQERFCPNSACPARGRVDEGNIGIHSQKEKRYKCSVCGKTFTERSGTAFYRLHHNEELMTVVIALLANGCPPQAIVAAYGLDERTVANWQERAGKHSQAVHEYLVQQPRELVHIQADEVRVKAQGQVLWMAMLIMVSNRLWLGGVVGKQRNLHLITQLMQILRTCALARPLLIAADGFAAYVTATQRVFRTALPTGKVGRPRLIPWPDIHIGQVVKQYQGRCVVGITTHGAGLRCHGAHARAPQSWRPATQHRLHRALECHLPCPACAFGTPLSLLVAHQGDAAFIYVSRRNGLQLLHLPQEPARVRHHRRKTQVAATYT